MFETSDDQERQKGERRFDDDQQDNPGRIKRIIQLRPQLACFEEGMLINKLSKLLCVSRLKTTGDSDENCWMGRLNSNLQCIAAATLFFRSLSFNSSQPSATWIIALPSKFIIKIKHENSSTLKFIFVIKLFIII